ncbi:hypothetical protein Pla110_38740 [Polystyrenella longa]|uniref:Zinc-finger domain-containing protein n=1 Tax=Polystyrenella longa TaxID=2528007 RepID=A0A518CSA3_9PLAN|nr:hypothetical protein [Polystyrenella longa]QDU82119.1 hypothetical protein Pla110_38740 [Polystyrenella longa]
MKKIVRVSSDLRSNLVAYLDGELDEDASHNVEILLAQSEVARHDVEMLSRSFDLLDMLPQEKASENFTEQTMASIAAIESHIPLFHQRWFHWVRKGLVVLCWLGIMGAASFGGYVVGQQIWPTRTEQVLEELPLYENLHIYREMGDVELLRQLLQQNLSGPLQGEYPEEVAPTDEEGQE